MSSSESIRIAKIAVPFASTSQEVVGCKRSGLAQHTRIQPPQIEMNKLPYAQQGQHIPAKNNDETKVTWTLNWDEIYPIE